MNTRKIARKSPRSKTKIRKAPARKTASKKTTVSRSAIRTAWTKSQMLTNIAESAELSRKAVGQVFSELECIIAQHLKQGGAGVFTLPGIIKMVTKRKPATKARKGINPFTGETTTFKAKPARNIVKVRPLKKLKEMVL
ncbi:MAG: HU family DNA-binding protein [Gammaproteobacteria bacterium]|nr:HU family DNA-binding protein [Gammaproteobacteria bacterium]